MNGLFTLFVSKTCSDNMETSIFMDVRGVRIWCDISARRSVPNASGSKLINCRNRFSDQPSCNERRHRSSHAGDAGKGFTVVADEIRKLSETSSSQSKTIGEQLKNIQDSIVEIVSASQESSTAFSGVSARIQETDSLVQSVRTSLETQNDDSRSVIGLLSNMEKNTENVRSASLKMSEGSQRVLEKMDKLQTSVDAVSESMEMMSKNASSVVVSGICL